MAFEPKTYSLNENIGLGFFEAGRPDVPWQGHASIIVRASSPREAAHSLMNRLREQADLIEDQLNTLPERR